ncbi:MAG TPA: hypothetical protein VGH80_14975 [Xanthomonadaceae bacterium]|jgi:hypothetical protein
MKSAPWVAGSALGLLLLALATASPFDSLQKTVPLDFAGIDTLEFRGNMSQIRISSNRPPYASYTDELDRPLDVRRTGSRMVITTSSERYLDVELGIPPSVRAIDAQYARIVTSERLQSMQVTSSGSVTWEGDIARLDLRDPADRPKHADDDCGCDGTQFSVSGGHIDELVVRSSHGQLSLSAPDKIDAVYAWLGGKKGVTLENAHRFDNIHLLATEAQLPDAASPKPATGP